MVGRFSLSKNNFIIFISAIIGVLCSAFTLKYLECPYAWISLYWALFFIFTTLRSARSWHKAIYYNLAVLIIFMGILEAIAFFRSSRDNTRQAGSYKTGYFMANDILGYAPQKDKSVDSKKYKGRELIYDVKYTINSAGLRQSAPLKLNDNHNQNPRPCVLFFGGSYTFGEGVNDFETAPYFVSQLSNAKTYNFGFHGYGPHQMLSAIEHGLVDQIIDCSPSVVVYQALPTHVARSAGRSSWDRHGPKYVLSQNGVEYAGPFDAKSNALIKIIKVLLDKSFIYKKYFADRTPINDEEDVKLFLEIINAARNKLAEKYPKAAFHVIFWDEPLETEGNLERNKKILEALKERRLNVHLISNILPNYLTDKSVYEISPYDKHPNALAHQYIAKYIVKEIQSAASE